MGCPFQDCGYKNGLFYNIDSRYLVLALVRYFDILLLHSIMCCAKCVELVHGVYVCDQRLTPLQGH